jgi:hypothetical protein
MNGEVMEFCNCQTHAKVLASALRLCSIAPQRGRSPSGLSACPSQWLLAPITPLKADEKENTMTIIELAILINALSGLASTLAHAVSLLRRRP